VAAGSGPLPDWKRDADFLFAQVRFSLDELLEWRTQVEFDGPVYAGVMVVPSVAMGRKIGADIKQLRVPDGWLAAIERDPAAGVALACDLVEGVRESGAFDGVHLIPVSKYREVAARLERKR
jgi:methylenetetrahydrofolate reductase (NADPH)